MFRAPDRSPRWRLSVLQLAQFALLLPLAALIRALVRGGVDILAQRRGAPLLSRAPLPAVLLDDVGESAPMFDAWEVRDELLPGDGDAAGWAAWQAGTGRAAAFAPAAGRTPRALPAGGRFLVVLSIVEGFGAWSDAVHETLALAKELNRTWVEPCVRNGCIEPCRCGAVRPVVAWRAARAASARAGGADPGALPRVDADCRLDDGNRRGTAVDFVGETYPLSAYIAVDARLRGLGAAAPAAVSYEAWCAAYAAEERPATEPAHRRWHAPHGYNFHLQGKDSDAPRAYGDFVFARSTSGRRAQSTPADALARLAADAAPSLFLFSFYRGVFAEIFSYPAAPVARWHRAAAAAFARGPLAGPPYAAFHWRSEQAPASGFAACAATIADIAAAALAPVPASRPLAAIVADMPAPANPSRMWAEYRDDGADLQRAAMAHLLGRGFAKYDAALLAASNGTLVDAGVLSLRDFLIAVGADWYVTCQGRHNEDCRACFRAGSNIVQRIRLARNARGASAHDSDKLFAVTRADVPPALHARPAGA